MKGALATRSWGLRRRGQSDAGSWAARTVARIGGTVILVLVVAGWPAARGASGSTPRPASEPTPQTAPTSGAGKQPTPDPAPQATTAPPASPRSTSTRPTIRAPAVVAPIRVPVVVTPARTVSMSAAKIVASRAPPSRSGRPTSPPQVRAVRVPTPRRARSEATRLPFPLAWPKYLLLLPARALHGGGTGHRDGILLLLTSLAMAALAVASLALLRRLRRLELR